MTEVTLPATAPFDDHARLRILIVAEHASAAFGGEAALPLHYFRVLRQTHNDVWLVVHARTRPELAQMFPNEHRILYVEDTRVHRLLWWLSRPLPARVGTASFGYLGRVYTQVAQRRLVRRLIAEQGVQIVHQPMPVSPREPSLMYRLGAPVVIGPMNGDMNFPPGFSHYDSRGVSAFVYLARAASALLNRLMPGKLECAVLAVANERTRLALPRGTRGKVIELVENGVDLALWTGTQAVREAPGSDDPVRFVFLGRLIDLKAVDLLMLAFQRASKHASMALMVVGDGPERERLTTLALQSGLLGAGEGDVGKVHFAGWKPQAECAEILRRSSVLVLPSLKECGGAVILEALAASRPVIATQWGGPADYVDPSCGILVKPESKDSFIADLTAALVKLASSPELRAQMGRAGRLKAEQLYDWNRKVERMVDVYREAIRLAAS